MHRFYVPAEALREQIVVIMGEEFKHLSNVLRLKAGDTVWLFDGVGHEFAGTIQYIEKEQAGIALGEPLSFSRESPLELYLVQGIPKGDKMELIIQKATELGVRGVIPLEAERSVVRLEGKKKEERRERWQKVAVEAAKQCRRALIPIVAIPLKLSELLRVLPSEKLLLIPWEEGGQPLKAVLTDPALIDFKSKAIYILIGPEGGWESREVAQAIECGAIPVTLGPRILRTETAGFAAVSAVMYQWGDLG